MRYLIIFLFISSFSCGTGAQQVRDFIPGVYVREFSHEFAFGYDTLIIRHTKANTYSIEKRSGYQRLREGKEPELVRNREQWTGLYNEREQHLMEQRRGKLLTFQLEEGKLLLGASEYYKVK